MKSDLELHSWDDVRAELLQDEETAKAYAIVMQRKALLNNLIEVRKSKQLTQVDIAKRIGVSRQAISKFEKGESSPTIDTLIGYATAMDIDFAANMKKIFVQSS
ncbi:transcriptional regulator [Yersinia frederiksenii]|uniref:helix-turn-helix domain-containing protein n=1 Tax=Yersinia alsatica TaxID=2890317 RepID=UPI0005E09A3D|nr:helix-turn-helix transcriptional regulator [Yersinia alsatica]OVZ94472.1 transcriptional regulator [Yersinia frederiksenii]CFQ60022.1 transcriptional regulator [Yersinia frederiksenii]CNI44755.1 transcriptional regulator [Yersinia frederiksenii]CNI74949.1 transcriptional regulator [Yersinia frederiksenii]CNK70884.1 transcriptional regulator [Yersinia frederiksenii]